MPSIDSILTLTLLLAALLLAVPVAVFSLQVLAAQPLRRSQPRPPGADTPATGSGRPNIAVLVPAHDEAAGLKFTLEAISAQLGPGDRLLVVADNCSDDTASVARAAGAITIERHDQQRIGKGYALDYGVRHLAATPPPVVVIIDADCLPGAAALERLACRCLQHGRPVQALYLMEAKPGAAMHTVVAQWAWRVKNWLRPLGAARLNLPCQLMGSGMAFPWKTISQAALANAHLVEDLRLGLELARSGQAPLFCPEALVTSQFPENPVGVRSQRMRWEHGHLGMIVRDAPSLLMCAMRDRNWQLLALTLDLCVPPLSLLILLVAAVACGTLLAAWLSDLTLLYVLALPTPLLLAVSVIAAWYRAGTDILPPSKMLHLPAHLLAYLIGKLPLYLRFLIRRQRRWIASARDKP